MTIPEILLPLFLVAIASYLIGSVSFSIIFTRIFTGRDVRNYGSGNAGTTNVLRTAGRLPALLTLAGDFLKGVAAVLFAQFIFSFFNGTVSDWISVGFFAGILCMLGHIFPIFFGFRGGKAVASTAAVVLIVDWRVFLIALAVFAVLLICTRIVSLSSMLAAVSVPVTVGIFAAVNQVELGWLDTLLAAVVALIVLYAHRSNIKRLREGKEPALSVGKKSGAR